MRIVIVGDGKVGYALTEELYREGHDITVVDTNAARLDKMSGVLDVSVIVGNGASMKVLDEAGVPHADLVIAATSTDELNMVCCLVAKKMGARRTIARIRNPEYNEQLRSLLQEELGLSLVINPDHAAAREISRLIRYPSALQAEVFAHGRAELIALRVEAGSPLDGLTLKNTIPHLGTKILVCAVERQSDVFIPGGDFTLQAGDSIHVTGTPGEISRFLKRTGRMTGRIREALIIGGGYIAVYLAHLLAEMNISVKIIEIKPERCAWLCEELPETMIIEGDGTDQELLESEGISTVGAFVALTNIDEENIIIAMYAADRGADKVVAKVNRLNYPNIIARTGINGVVSPKLLTASQIIRFVRGMREHGEGDGELRTLYQLLGGRAEALDFRIVRDMKYLNIPIAQLPLKPNLLIALIVRGGKAFLPNGQSRLLLGDSVIVIAQDQRIKSLNGIFKG